VLYTVALGLQKTVENVPQQTPLLKKSKPRLCGRVHCENWGIQY